jgi:putative peptidoglycan lipid II flippase
LTEKKQILKSASIISLVTIVSRVLGYVRDQRISFLLGTSLSADAFVLAYRMPNLFRRLVGEGTVAASFIPLANSSGTLPIDCSGRLLWFWPSSPSSE